MQVDGLLGENRRYRSTWDCFQNIYRQEGVKAFYKGVSTNMMKAFPGIAIVCKGSMDIFLRWNLFLDD
jgi:hypothetical protein